VIESFQYQPDPPFVYRKQISEIPHDNPEFKISSRFYKKVKEALEVL